MEGEAFAACRQSTVRRLALVDDAIDEWHDMALEEYTLWRFPSLPAWLGWTRAEYAAWVESGVLPPRRPLAL